MDGIGSVFELLLGLPGALGLLMALAVGMGALHLLVNWVLRPGRSLRDRGGALVLVAAAAVVPLAALGYVRTDWHAHLGVRVVEAAFGLTLLGLVGWWLVAVRRPGAGQAPTTATGEPAAGEPTADGHPTVAGHPTTGEPSHYLSVGPDAAIPAPAFATSGLSQRLHALSLSALLAGSAIAYVAHAFDLFHHAWR